MLKVVKLFIKMDNCTKKERVVSIYNGTGEYLFRYIMNSLKEQGNFEENALLFSLQWVPEFFRLWEPT